MRPLFIETGDYFEFPVEGDTVSRLAIDYAFTIFLQDTHLTVVVEQEFAYSSGSTSGILRAPDRLTPVLELIHKPVRSLRAFKNGRLTFAAAPDITMTVEPDANYESWHVNGDFNLLIVCMLGGKLAVWPGSEGPPP